MDTSYTVNKPINITGNLISVEKDKNLTNILVILEVSNGDNKIYKTILRSDSNGFFDTTFTPSITGTLKVNAYASNSSNTNSLRIFEVKGILEDQILIIIIFILILY
jgi:hypothetical protein